VKSPVRLWSSHRYSFAPYRSIILSPVCETKFATMVNPGGPSRACKECKDRRVKVSSPPTSELEVSLKADSHSATSPNRHADNVSGSKRRVPARRLNVTYSLWTRRTKCSEMQTRLSRRSRKAASRATGKQLPRPHSRLRKSTSAYSLLLVIRKSGTQLIAD
jgi:hypothetical protein